MADENLSDDQSNQVDGILPPEGSFVDEEDEKYQDGGGREDNQRHQDWRRAASEIKKQAGSNSKSDQLAPSAKTSGGQSANTASQQAKAAGPRPASGAPRQEKSSSSQPASRAPHQGQVASPAGGAKPSAASAGSSGAGRVTGGSGAGSKAAFGKQAAQNLADDKGNPKEAVKDTAEMLANQASDKAVRGATGGIVGFQGGSAGREILERKQRGEGFVGARVRAALNDITIFGVKLKYWLLAAVIWQLLMWIMLMGIVVISMVAVCEAASYKIFGVDIGLKAGGVITGVDLEALCGEISVFTNRVLGGSPPGAGAGECVNVTGSGGISCAAGCDRGDKVSCTNQYDQFIAEASRTYGIEENLIRAIIQQESQWRNGLVSSSGAVGLMQILPATWRSIGCPGVAYFDPRTNILCGTKYLKTISDQLTAKFGPGIGRNIRYIAAAYNAGPASSGCPRGCPFDTTPRCPQGFAWECAFGNPEQTTCSVNGWRETRNYATSVVRFYNDYQSGSCSANSSS